MSGVPPRGGEKSCSVYAMAQDYEIKVKVTGVDQAKASVDDLTESLQDAGSESSQLQLLDKITGGAVSGFKNATAGVKKFITGLKLTRAAIIATGVGALVVAVTALVAAFTKTRRGGRLLKTVMAGVGAVVEQITARFQILGGFIVDLFTQGPTAAVQNYKKAMDDLPPSIQDAIDKSMELERATQALTDAQRALTVQRAKDRAEIKELNMIAEDTTRTLEEREAAAQKAIDIEKGLMAERERIAAEELRIAQEKAAMSDTSDEDLQNLANLEANLINIRTESVELQTTLNNKLNTIRAEAARKAEEEAKRIADAAAEKAKAEQEAADAIAKSEQEVVDALAARDRANLDARTKEILALEDFYNTQLDKAGENAELIAQIEAQREEELAAMRERFRQEDAEKAEAARQKELEAQEEAGEKEKELVEQIEDAKAQLKTDAISSTFSILKNLTAASEKDTEASAKKAFNRNKAISIAETLITTYMAAQKAYASQILPGDPTSPVRATIAAGIAVAAGLAKVAKIKSQQFTGGGSTGGGGGGGTGVGGGTQSVGVDVGSLIPNQQTPTPEPVRAYVVSNEISNKQALDRELQIQTTL